MRTIQVIYFDPDDHDADGFGWNVVDNGSIASRYTNVASAMSACYEMDLPFVVLSAGVTPAEAVSNIESVMEAAL